MKRFIYLSVNVRGKDESLSSKNKVATRIITLHGLSFAVIVTHVNTGSFQNSVEVTYSGY